MTALEELLNDHLECSDAVKNMFLEKEKQQIIEAYEGGVNSGSFVGTHFVFKGNADDYYKKIKGSDKSHS